MRNRFHTAMDNDKTKVIMGLIVASLREGLGMSRYALAQEALTIRGCGVSNRESPGSGWKPLFGLQKDWGFQREHCRRDGESVGKSRYVA